MQEMSKYLRGYHDCTKEDMFKLGGLLFRVKVDSDRSQFVMIPKMLKDLVPADQLKIMSAEDWKKVKDLTYRNAGDLVSFLLKKMESVLRFEAMFFHSPCSTSSPRTRTRAASRWTRPKLPF